jgi:hypothetical protein
MLRITRCVDGDRELLKLEGKLLGPWVAELTGVSPPGPAAAGARLDLAALTFVDEAGIRLLRDLLDRGAVVLACSGFVAEMLRLEVR